MAGVAHVVVLEAMQASDYYTIGCDDDNDKDDTTMDGAVAKVACCCWRWARSYQIQEVLTISNSSRPETQHNPGKLAAPTRSTYCTSRYRAHTLGGPESPPCQPCKYVRTSLYYFGK